jgi:hypothetical protein
MNAKFFLVWFLALLIWFGGTYVINVYLILEQWFTVPFLRPWEEELERYHFMVLPHVLYAGVAVWLYKRRGPAEGNWITSGLVFGFMLSLITIVPMRMLNYTTFSMPGRVVVNEALLWIPLLLVVGLVIAWFYRDQRSS